MASTRLQNMRKPVVEQRSRQIAEPAEDRPNPHPVLRLQQQVGNAQIARMVPQQGPSLTPLIPEVGLNGGPISNRLMARIQAQRGRGASLDQAKRTHFEERLDLSLEGVHIHTGEEAAVLNQSISAQAFTIGDDIFLRHPGDAHDMQLLAHELTHVKQQRSMDGGGPMVVGPADDHMEQQAHQEADTLAQKPDRNQAHAPAGQAGEASIQRDFMDELSLGNIAGLVGLGGSAAQGALESSNRGLAALAETTPANITNAGPLNALGGLTSVLGLVTGTRDMLDENKAMPDRVVGGMSAASGATGLAGYIGSLFGTSALSAGGATGLTASAGTALGGGLGAGAAIGSAGAVLGAGAAGYGLGRLLDEGVGAAGRAITGDEQGDYTISGGLASMMTAADRGVSSLWADPDRPAYTQTIGWQLGELLGI